MGWHDVDRGGCTSTIRNKRLDMRGENQRTILDTSWACQPSCSVLWLQAMAPKMVFSRSPGSCEGAARTAIGPICTDVEATTPAAKIEMDGKERLELCKRVLRGGPEVFVTFKNELRLGYDVNSTIAAERVGRWVNALGECADPGCPCSRAQRPGVREAFRVHVTALATIALRGRSSIRYTSLASGMLLTDFEMLVALEDTGCAVSQIVFVDTLYGSQGPSRQGKARQGPQSRAQLAANQVAAFFPSAALTLFESLGAYEAACSIGSYVASDTDLLLASDPASVVVEAFPRIAAAALAPHGLACALFADYSTIPPGTLTRCYQKSSSGCAMANPSDCAGLRLLKADQLPEAPPTPPSSGLTAVPGGC